MAILRPTVFDDGIYTWTDPEQTYDANDANYGYFNAGAPDSPGAGLAVWSGWSNDTSPIQTIKVKLSTASCTTGRWGLRISAEASPTWPNPADYTVMEALSGDNVGATWYEIAVPEGWDLEDLKVCCYGSREGEPSGMTINVYDVQVLAEEIQEIRSHKQSLG